MDTFRNAVAIVTGGGMGLGQALCEELAQRGAVVIVADIKEQAAQHVAASIIQQGGRARAVTVDVANETDVERLVDGAVAEFGRLDYIFNNAVTVIGGEARDISIAQWNHALAVDLNGEIYGALNAYRVMVQQGHGHIVNISSLSGLIPQPGNAPYCTAKHGIIGFSLSLRFEGADLGVRVSAVCPGDMKTSIYENMMVMNMPLDAIVRESRKSHFLMPQMSAADSARIILRGVARNQPLIVFPEVVRWIWRLDRFLPTVMYWVSLYRMRMFRPLRTAQ